MAGVVDDIPGAGVVAGADPGAGDMGFGAGAWDDIGLTPPTPSSVEPMGCRRDCLRLQFQSFPLAVTLMRRGCRQG